MQKIYVKRVFIATLATALFTAALNFVVDPYGIYRAVDREGLNRIKPKAGPSSLLVKPYAVESIRPKTLVLGNSRTEAGIDPQSPLWPETYRPVFNMALPATGIDVALKSLLHVSEITPVETVLLGLDFRYFLVNPPTAAKSKQKPQEPSEFDKRLYVYGDASGVHPDFLQRLKDRVSTLFSINAIVDSVITLAMQGQPDQPDLTGLGFNPMREYRRFAKTDGYPLIFGQVESTYFSSYLRDQKVLYNRPGNTSEDLERLRSFIRFCHKHNIRLLLYIHPYHAHMLEMYRIAGFWPMFEEWKRALTRIVDDESGAFPDRPKPEVWDFSGYNDITTERLPTVAEKGLLMKWYWEAGHYNSAVGNLILARLLSTAPQEGSLPAGFGIRLTTDNVEDWITATRNLREDYARRRSDEIDTLVALAGKIHRQIKTHPRSESAADQSAVQ